MGTKMKNLIGKKLEGICSDRGWSSYMLSGASGVPLTTVLHIVDGSTKNPGGVYAHETLQGTRISDGQISG